MYNSEIVDKICAGLIAGRSLKSICEDADMPARSTVLGWLQNDAMPGFLDKYARARELQAEAYLDDIIEIADNTTNDDTQTDYGPIPNHEWITRSKIRIDARKWAMSKLAPKKYGDSKQLDVTSGGQRITGIAIVDYADDSAA